MIRLKYQAIDEIPVEAECLTPDRLHGRDLASIRQLSVWHGNQERPLRDFFTIEGESAAGIMEIHGDCSTIKRIGEGMTFGQLTVHGPVGMHTGARMSGGRLEIWGHTGDWAGAQMAGGSLVVHGNAGDNLGAAYRGESQGMTGGCIIIHGNAGDETGAYMRRGLIAIAGDCGAFAGVSQIAGSLIIGGKLGDFAGANMKRGTIVALGSLGKLPPSFCETTVYEPGFLALFAPILKSFGFSVPKLAPPGRYIRYGGDAVSLGQGEILHRCANTE
jgi:formylmethanofuran dehydrogenase subunit C